ncbi:hypothetical protein K474DRAFT_621649 [Panus rudis PR-1116 ss-1]|nr:hypothetical protein K474DRAFT_621649 [Panus rudis PR-1116 ss-1]
MNALNSHAPRHEEQALTVCLLGSSISCSIFLALSYISPLPPCCLSLTLTRTAYCIYLTRIDCLVVSLQAAERF